MMLIVLFIGLNYRSVKSTIKRSKDTIPAKLPALSLCCERRTPKYRYPCL